MSIKLPDFNRDLNKSLKAIADELNKRAEDCVNNDAAKSSSQVYKKIALYLRTLAAEI